MRMLLRGADRMADSYLEMSLVLGEVLGTMRGLVRKIEALTVFAEQPDGRWHATNPLWPTVLGSGLTKQEAAESMVAEIEKEGL